MVPYLLASLPTPRLGETPDIAVGTVLERCAGFVGEERARDLAWVLGSRRTKGAGTRRRPTATTTRRRRRPARP
jgi:hypothetical protein